MLCSTRHLTPSLKFPAQRLLIILASLLATDAFGHAEHHLSLPQGPEGIVETSWPQAEISRLVSAGYGESLGTEAYPRQGFPNVHEHDASLCATGSYLAFDVNDSYAFDIDETVELSFRIKANGGHAIHLGYDRNVVAESFEKIELDEPEQEWNVVNIALSRARFANRGQADTDFFIIPFSAVPESLQLDKTHQITLCDLSLKRSYKTKKHTSFGELDLSAVYNNIKTPVRIGLYDASGRMPLPSADALPFQHYARSVRQHFLRDGWGSHDPWPAENRHIFYSDGHYRAKLPTGSYQLILSKGPEFHIYKKTIEIAPNATLSLNAELQRFIDLPKQGWYSGDGHIHLTRDSAADNQNVLPILAAEDVHVSNLLQMGNFSSRHFSQYAFGKDGQYVEGNHAIAPGTEDPRTAHRGHTIGLNIQAPVHDRENYYLYHKVFAAHQRQGGLTGYAHVQAGWFNEDRGLALDVPFGLVDFVEIMQNGSIFTELWYDLLNLGYQIQPMAGSDYPYIDQPGSVRSYAKLNGPFSADAWFDAVKKGHVYVSNAPFLELDVNGKSMGDSLNIASGESLHINASVSLNPDFDSLDRIELVIQGEVVAQLAAKQGQHSLSISHSLSPNQGLWLAVRAFGKKQALAHSAPVYIHTAGASHWSKQKAPAIARKMITQLENMKTNPDPAGELEFWAIRQGFEGLWQQQKMALYSRIDEAISRYQSLIEKSE